MEKRKVKAVLINKDKYDPRYAIMDEETGEILDDNNTEGYENINVAYREYTNKFRKTMTEEEKRIRSCAVKKWLYQHRDFAQAMDQFSFEIAKGSWGPEERFNNEFVERMLKDNDLKCEFNPYEIMKAWKKKAYEW